MRSSPIEVTIVTDEFTLLFDVIVERDSFDHAFGTEHFNKFTVTEMSVFDLDLNPVNVPISEFNELFKKYQDSAATKAERIYSEEN